MTHDHTRLIDPVRELIDEHVIFMSALEELVGISATVGAGTTSIDAATLAALQGLVDTVDEHLNVHFLKEEEIFFPAIERLFPSARVKFQFLHVDHDRLREAFELFIGLVQHARHGRLEPRRFGELSTIATEMVRLFYYHIVAEDAVYLDVASQMLSREEAAALYERMHRLEERLRERCSVVSLNGREEA